MIFTKLLIHEWKKGFRAQGFYKNLVVNILLGMFFVYLAAVFIFIGFSLNELLHNLNPTLSPLHQFHGMMLYAIVTSVCVRFFMQQLTGFNIEPYQTLPIKRITIINFLLFKPLLNVVNYFILLLVVPFAFDYVAVHYGAFVAVRFVLTYVMLIWFNSLSTNYLKRRFGNGFFASLTVVFILCSTILMEQFKVFSLFDISHRLFDFIVLRAYGLLVPIAVLVGVYLLNIWFFNSNYYPEVYNKRMQPMHNRYANFTLPSHYGLEGELIGLYLKLILRNKRTKNTLLMSILFLFYGLLFYTNDIYTNSPTVLFFVALFETGLFSTLLGQFILRWHSSHFDGWMTMNISKSVFVRANYFTLLLMVVLSFIVTMPYFYFGATITWLHITAFLYNAGCNVLLVLYFTTYNNTRFDLSQSSNAINYKGASYKNFLVNLPMLLVPGSVFSLLVNLWNVQIAEWLMAILGVVGMIASKPILKICEKQLERKKYSLAEGFRHNE